jgi:hypothetical protein
MDKNGLIALSAKKRLSSALGRSQIMNFPLTPDQQFFLMFILRREIDVTAQAQTETDDPAQQDKLHYHKVRVMELAKMFGHGTGGGTGELIAKITPWAGSEEQAKAWFSTYPIPAFGGKTAEEIVAEGKIGAVKQYIEHIADGGYA